MSLYQPRLAPRVLPKPDRGDAQLGAFPDGESGGLGPDRTGGSAVLAVSLPGSQYLEL